MNAEIPTTKQWLDAFFGSMEVIAEMLSDEEQVRRQFSGQLDPSAAFDKEAYKERVSIWKRVRDRLLSFDIEEIEFEGASQGAFGITQDAGGDFIVSDPAGLALYRYGEQTKMFVPHPEAQCVANFLSFYLASYSKGVNPQQYVRSVLAEKGITSENFHQYADQLLIDNPWQ